MGISYGTHVALQYARAFPDHVAKLILDSIVGPDQPDGFLLDTYRNLPRVLREQCANNACRGITNDPVADVGTLVTPSTRGARCAAAYYDPSGARARPATPRPTS